MDRLIYTALSGMQSSMNRQRVVASNMANAQTTGFRAEVLDQRPVTVHGTTLDARVMQQGEVRGAIMNVAEIVQTGHELDVAMNGQAMMAVQGMDGSEAYTRRGDLQISPSGLLSNGDGRPVMGYRGPITVPVGGQVTITPDGTVMVTDPTVPDEPPQEAGRIKLVSWQGSQIAKGLDGLFRVKGDGVLPADEEATLIVRSLEQSNVNASEVLIEMIDAQRMFAMRTKTIAAAREVDESGAQLMRIS